MASIKFDPAQDAYVAIIPRSECIARPFRAEAITKGNTLIHITQPLPAITLDDGLTYSNLRATFQILSKGLPTA